MKLRKLLVCGIATGLLVGCSTTPDDQKPQLTEETRIKDKERKIEQNTTIQYLFGNSAKVKLLLPGVIGGSDELWGTLSSPMKETIKSIWRALEKQGFSGYDVSLLDAENVRWHDSFNGIYNLTSLAPPQADKDFHHRFIEYLVSSTPNLSLSKEYFPIGSAADFKYSTVLFGLKFNNKALTFVKIGEGKYEAVLADEFRQDPSGKNSVRYIPPKIDSDIPVTQEQIDDWNQVFIDVLKEDPFFGQQMNTPADLSGRVSTVAGLKGKTGVDAAQLRLNGVAGAQIDFGLPVYVQLAGDVDKAKTTEGVTGLVAYRFGNTAIGAIQSYANASNAHHTETSVVAAQSLGNMYIEGQLGTISFKGGSGMRSQVKVGIDTSYGMPFVQLTHRDFGSTTDTAAYIGFEIANAEFKADTYAFSTTLLTRVGHHSAQGVTGSVDLNAALNLKSGVGFNTCLTIGSTVESKAAFNMSIDR